MKVVRRYNLCRWRNGIAIFWGGGEEFDYKSSLLRPIDATLVRMFAYRNPGNLKYRQTEQDTKLKAPHSIVSSMMQNSKVIFST